MSKWRKSFSFLLWINLCHHGESAFNLPHFDYWSRQNKIENLKYQNFLIRQIIKISKWQHVIHSRWRNSTMMTNSEIKLQIKVFKSIKLFRCWKFIFWSENSISIQNTVLVPFFSAVERYHNDNLPFDAVYHRYRVLLAISLQVKMLDLRCETFLIYRIKSREIFVIKWFEFRVCL